MLRESSKKIMRDCKEAGYNGINFLGIEGYTYEERHKVENRLVPFYTRPIYSQGVYTGEVEVASIDKKSGQLYIKKESRRNDGTLIYSSMGYSCIDSTANEMQGKGYVELSNGKYSAVFRADTVIATSNAKVYSDELGCTAVFSNIDFEELRRLSIMYRGYLVVDKGTKYYAPEIVYKKDGIAFKYKGILSDADRGEIDEEVNLQQFICDIANKDIPKELLGDTWLSEKGNLIKIENARYVVYTTKEYIGIYSTTELYLPVTAYTVNKHNRLYSSSRNTLVELATDIMEIGEIPLICDTVHEADESFVGSIRTDRHIDSLLVGTKVRDVYITGNYKGVVADLIDLVYDADNKRVFIGFKLDYADVTNLIKCVVDKLISDTSTSVIKLMGYDNGFISSYAATYCKELVCYDSESSKQNKDRTEQIVEGTVGRVSKMIQGEEVDHRIMRMYEENIHHIVVER